MNWHWRPTRDDWIAVARAGPLLLVVGIAAVLSYRYHLLLIAQRDRVEHTYQVITSLESTFAHIIDAETGQRGFLLTGDPAYLQPYDQASQAIPASLARLRGLIADSPAQLDRARLLDARLQAKLGELKEAIDARRRAGLQAAVAIVARDRGRQEMDAVRGVIGEMRATEADLLARRNADARATEQRLLTTTIACLAASLVARAGIAIVLRRRALKASAR